MFGNIANICFGLQVGMKGGMVGFSSINMVQWNPLQQLQAMQALQTFDNLRGWPIWTTRDWKYANVKWTTISTRTRVNVKPFLATWNGGNISAYLSKQHTT